MAAKKKIPTWAIVTIGIVGCCVLGFVTLVGAGIYLFAKHVDIAEASEVSADRAFAETRARLVNETPLISLNGDDWETDATVNRRVNADARKPRTLHVMAWDPDDERLVNVSIPFWLLRLGDRVNVDVNFDEDDPFGELDLTVTDLDQYGPGLIVDYVDSANDRVLMWTE